MNIGLFSDAYPPIMDGVALTVRNSAHWLQAKMNSVRVFTPHHPNASTSSNSFAVERYASMPAIKRRPYRVGLPFVDLAFMARFRQQEFDLVHAHSPFSAGKLAWLKARNSSTPLVATFHSKYRDDFMQAFKSNTIADMLVKNIISFYNKADEVWIPQASVEDTLREYGYKGKLEVVNNGIDMDAFQVHKLGKGEARKVLGIPNDQAMFLFVGQHIWEKNLKLILESLALLKNLHFKAFFIGEGYARAELEQLSKKLHLEDRLCFLGVMHQRELLAQYYAAADLFLFPSKYDNAPLVVREAAAAGTPSLLLENSTAADVISHGINGFLAQDSPQQYAQAIREALNSPHYLHIVQNAAATLCRSWDSVADELCDRYQSLIARKRKDRSTYLISGQAVASLT